MLLLIWKLFSTIFYCINIPIQMCACICVCIYIYIYMGLPCSAGKESAFYAGDPSSIPGSGRSCGEGMGYPLQYSWVSLVAQMEMNTLATRETGV